MAINPVLLASSVGTFFESGRFHHFDWDRFQKVNGTEGTLVDLNVDPGVLAAVDAACVNPLDPDLVWLFKDDEVVDYRVSTRSVVGGLFRSDNGQPAVPAFPDDLGRPAGQGASKLTQKQKLRDHEIFRALPPAFHRGLVSVVLHTGTNVDAAVYPSAPNPVTTSHVNVAIDYGGQVFPGNSIWVREGATRMVWLTLSFANPGTYRVFVTRPSGDSQGWDISFGQYAEEQEKSSRDLTIQTNDTSAPERVALVISSSPLKPRPIGMRLTVKVEQTAPTRALAYETVLHLFEGQELPAPGLAAFNKDAMVIVWLWSLRRATVEGPFGNPPGFASLRAYVNGLGRRGDTHYRFDESQYWEGRNPKALELPDWCRMSAGGPVLKAAAQVRLSRGTGSSTSGTPSGSASLLLAPGDEPPEKLVAIPGRRNPNLDTSLQKWIADLPPCKHLGPEKGVPPEEILKRKELFIERVTNEGDMPDFLRTFVAVRTSNHKFEVVYYAMPDFIAVGHEANLLYLPLSARAGQAVTDYYNKNGCKLIQPSFKMAEQIYHQEGTQRMVYVGLPGQDKLSQDYVRQHNSMIEAQRFRRGYVFGRLSSGHRKEVVVEDHVPSATKGTLWWGGVLTERPFSLPYDGKPSLSHTNEKSDPAKKIYKDAFDHDEYAQAQRLVHREGWIRPKGDPKAVWRKVDLVSVMMDADRYDLLAVARWTREVRYPGTIYSK